MDRCKQSIHIRRGNHGATVADYCEGANGAEVTEGAVRKLAKHPDKMLQFTSDNLLQALQSIKPGVAEW